MEVALEREGWLWKKSPSGFKGFKAWQKRWFVIGAKSITYYKNPGDKKPLGLIPLAQVLECQYLPDKRIGCRFDIKVHNLRDYALHGAYMEDAKAWTAAINTAVARYKKQQGGGGSKFPKLATPTDLTKLQLCFAKARFGDVFPGDPSVEEKVFSWMRQETPTDEAVLRWLLVNFFHPKAGKFMWDQRTDVEVFESDSKALRILEEKKDALVGGAVASAFSSDMALSLIKCSQVGCLGPPVGDSELCVVHINARTTKDLSTADGRTYEMIKSSEFLRLLCKLFETREKETHGVALRVLWVLFRGLHPVAEAGSQFYWYVSLHCSGPRLNSVVISTLLQLLLSVNPLPVQESIVISFYLPVHNTSIWRALFGALVGSDFGLRKQGLEDINTILHENKSSCESLSSGKDWQDWILQLFVDLPKNKARTDQTVKTLFAYSVNAITLIHYQYFLTRDNFSDLINSTLQHMQQFGGSSTESCSLASITLTALVSKLTSQKKMFPAGYSAASWQNLTPLTQLLKKFIFKSAFWNTGTSEEDSRPDVESDSISSASSKSEGQYMLAKLRGQKDKSWDNARDLGFHWNDEGSCADLTLVEKLTGLLKALGVHELPASGVLEKEEKDVLAAYEKEFQFWEDSVQFCSLFRRIDIDRKILTYRWISNTVKAFLDGSTRPARKAVIQDAERIITRGVPVEGLSSPGSPSGSVSVLIGPGSAVGGVGSPRSDLRSLPSSSSFGSAGAAAAAASAGVMGGVEAPRSPRASPPSSPTRLYSPHSAYAAAPRALGSATLARPSTPISETPPTDEDDRGSSLTRRDSQSSNSSDRGRDIRVKGLRNPRDASAPPASDPSPRERRQPRPSAALAPAATPARPPQPVRSASPPPGLGRPLPAYSAYQPLSPQHSGRSLGRPSPSESGPSRLSIDHGEDEYYDDDNSDGEDLPPDIGPPPPPPPPDPPQLLVRQSSGGARSPRSPLRVDVPGPPPSPAVDSQLLLRQSSSPRAPLRVDGPPPPPP